MPHSSKRPNDLTRLIIGCAYTVHNTLGFGFLESVYEKSLLIELDKKGISACPQKPIKVYYNSHIVGNFYADLVIDNQLIIELKSIANLSTAHEVQLVNYLNATGIKDGLLINFGPESVEIKRKYRRYKKIRQD